MIFLIIFIRYKFLILCFLWFCVGGNYYGLSIYLKRLPGDIYLNGIIIYTFEAFSYFFAGYIVNVSFVGRKGTLISFYCIAVLCFGCLSFLNLEDFYTTSITFIARFAIAGIYNIFYNYSLENYPTPVRALAFGINNLFAKIGAVLFPILIEVIVEYISFLFVSMNIICLGLMMFLPETIGKNLKEEIEEEAEIHITNFSKEILKDQAASS
jgi:MFS family permease